MLESVARKKNKPPKKWFDKMVREIRKGNPDFSEEQVNAIVGDIWYNKLSDAKKTELKKSFFELGSVLLKIANRL